MMLTAAMQIMSRAQGILFPGLVGESQPCAGAFPSAAELLYDNASRSGSGRKWVLAAGS